MRMIFNFRVHTVHDGQLEKSVWSSVDAGVVQDEFYGSGQRNVHQCRIAQSRTEPGRAATVHQWRLFQHGHPSEPYDEAVQNCRPGQLLLHHVSRERNIYYRYENVSSWSIKHEMEDVITSYFIVRASTRALSCVGEQCFTTAFFV